MDLHALARSNVTEADGNMLKTKTIDHRDLAHIKNTDHTGTI